MQLLIWYWSSWWTLPGSFPLTWLKVTVPNDRHRSVSSQLHLLKHHKKKNLKKKIKAYPKSFPAWHGHFCPYFMIKSQWRSRWAVQARELVKGILKPGISSYFPSGLVFFSLFLFLKVRRVGKNLGFIVVFLFFFETSEQPPVNLF